MKKIFLILTVMAILSAGTGQCQPAEQPILKADDNAVSLNIKGMDILDVLKMFSGYAGMNIVVGKNVTGRVSLFLKNVAVMDAFDIILLANDLAFDKKNGIIYVMTQRDYELLYGRRSDEKRSAKIIPLKNAHAADLAVALNQIKSNLGKIVVDPATNTLVLIDTSEKVVEMENFARQVDVPLKTIIFDLDYAQADKLSAKLQDLVTKNVGTVKVDERTNKIAVTDYPDRIDEIARIVSAFDEKTMQVLIDAQIMEINPQKSFKMGVDWDYWIKKNFHLVASLPTPGAGAKLSIGTAASGLTPSDPKQYSGIIDALKTIGDVKILSSPRIMALNSQEARILVGTKQPYASQTSVTGDGGVVTVAETINFVDVGIKLYVTPTINRDGFVTMKIRPEVSSTGNPYLTAKGEAVPVVSTSEAETAVMVKDGVTIIIGGLTKNEVDNEVSQVPLLGDIPVLGNLFKRTSKTATKSELVILLTPHITGGEATFSDFNQIQAKDGSRARMLGDDLIIEKSNPPAAVKLPEMSSEKEYCSAVTEKVKALALFGQHPRSGSVKVAFTVRFDGKLADEPAASDASDPELVPYAIKAIKSASPFPPFPDSLRKEKEDFTAELTFE